MNRENMKEAARLVRDDGLKLNDQKVGFNMSTFISESGYVRDKRGTTCNTTACIAGTVAIAVLGKKALESDCEEVARQHLGLTELQAGMLFFATNSGKFLRDITHEEAARVMEAMIASDNDEVLPNWVAVCGEVPNA